MHFLQLIFSRYILKGSTMDCFAVLTFAEAGESCLSPRPRVQSAPERLFYSHFNAMK